MKKILITGSQGFIGSYLCAEFLRNGYKVVGIDNFSTGKREVVPPQKGLRVIEGSIVDKLLVNKVFSEFQLLLNRLAQNKTWIKLFLHSHLI